jgi:hypothetical protein
MRLGYQVPLLLLLEIAMLHHTCVAEFEPQVGEALNDFVLPRIDNGEPVSPSAYRGRKVLLVMFASW